jgi:hypothetical protein
MRQFNDTERLHLANLITSEGWKLASELMEEALEDVKQAALNAPADATDAVIANRVRGFNFAHVFYQTYIQRMQREIQQYAQISGIAPDTTEEFMGLGKERK